jgi:hypothetical protein
MQHINIEMDEQLKKKLLNGGTIDLGIIVLIKLIKGWIKLSSIGFAHRATTM